MDPHDDGLDGVLFEAFGPGEGESVLGAIERLHGASSSVLLREVDEEATPVLMRSGAGAATDDSRYQVLGEIARGGIGIVYKGRDKDLNREVALKVLRAEYATRADVVQRFVEEAQVGGQLQHPGIVPVYGLGLQADGRPSFAMKLVKGRTLAELLESNPKGIDRVAVFQQVVQTIAYAHSRGVIHRDLKPANVMVGAFGEVQVVDWGFAKVLGQEEPARPEQTIIETVRSGPEGSQSMVGSVMGTPAYMPPEQALGRIEELDERADVFSLGAILCQILTGEPPYTGEPRDQLVAAVQSRLGPAFERLDACDAPEGLKAVVRQCLEPIATDRPREAGVVAEALRSHFAGVEQRAHEAEIEAVASEAREARAKDARRRTVLLSGVGLVALFVFGGVWLWLRHDAEAREAAVAPVIETALREATSHEGRGDWAQATAAAKRAVDLARSEGVHDAGAHAMLVRLEAARSAADEAARRRAEDDRFLARLDGVRGARSLTAPLRSASEVEGSVAPGRATWGSAVRRVTAEEYSQILAADYRSAFAEAFPRWEEMAPRLRASEHAEAFAAHLLAWSFYVSTSGDPQGPSSASLVEAACQVDPDHADVVRALARRDGASLRAAVAEAGLDLTPGLATWVAAVLQRDALMDEAQALLEAQVARHPSNSWLHEELALLAQRRGDFPRMLDHAEAVTGLHPELPSAWVHLAWAWSCVGNLHAAAAASARARALEPNNPAHAVSEGEYLLRSGDLDGAEERYRRAIDLDPRSAARSALGALLLQQGRIEEALTELQAAVAQHPESILAHEALATALLVSGDAAGALRAARKALVLYGTTPLDPRRDPARYTGACAAARLGGVVLDEALGWLRADLDAWEAILEAGEASVVVSTMRHWKQDTDLAPARDGADLPEDWQRLWTDVDALLARAEEASR